MYDPTSILSILLESTPTRLKTIPQGQGIYALYDHEGHARYIGITAKCLNDRIFKRHVGGDDNSHKFSTVYNAGRMFHARKAPISCPRDGKIAKELRRLFVREHCRAVAIALPGLSRAELLSLEANVLAAAPADAKSWNDARVLSAAEPIDQLNAFLAKIEWPPEKHLAVNRQAERWQSLAR